MEDLNMVTYCLLWWSYTLTGLICHGWLLVSCLSLVSHSVCGWSHVLSVMFCLGGLLLFLWVVSYHVCVWSLRLHRWSYIMSLGGITCLWVVSHVYG